MTSIKITNYKVNIKYMCVDKRVTLTDIYHVSRI